MMELSAPVACQYSMCTGPSLHSEACAQHRNCCHAFLWFQVADIPLVCPTSTHDLKIKSFTGRRGGLGQRN